MENSDDNFELSLKRLEELVVELERGDLPLEKSLARYEEGMNRLKRCYRILDEVEKKIVLITRKDNGEIEEIPFDRSNNLRQTDKKSKTLPG